MRNKAYVLFCSLAILLIFISFPSEVNAQTNSIYYESAHLNYNIQADGTVNAQLNYTLVNETTNTKVTYITRTVSANQIQDIKVEDGFGTPLQYETTSTNESTTIKVLFNGKAGPGKTINFSISYSTPNFLEVTENSLRYHGTFGGIKLNPRNTPYHQYIIEVMGPPNTELFTYSPSGTTFSGNEIRYETQLNPPTEFSGLEGTWFKSPAYYKVTLNEEISNGNASEKTTDLNYELLLFNREDDWQYSAVSDAPRALKHLYFGEENNWEGGLKINSLEPGESKKFQIELISQLKIKDDNIVKTNVGSLAEISSNFEPFLRPKEHWQSDNPTIQNTAEIIMDNETNCYTVAKKIMEFVRTHLEYENQTNRLGALKAYQTGVGDCSEYTDLSIALARAAGLPARASYGWGFQNGELIGHAWPEFYFPGVGWQPADPTWVDTGGRIEPGGIRPRFRFPGGGGDKFSPVLFGSSASYLGRMDPIHVQRNLRWVNSSESYGRYYYDGVEPEISEVVGVDVLSESEAASVFLDAARLGENRASELLKDSDNEVLFSELELAESYLSQAKAAGVPSQVIELSKKSINHSSMVLKAKGKPAERESGFFDFPYVSKDLLIKIILIVVIISAGYLAFRSRF